MRDLKIINHIGKKQYNVNKFNFYPLGNLPGGGGKKVKKFLDAEEVSQICNVKKSRAYAIMKQINEEYKKKGYMTIRGKVNSKFLCERFGIDEHI